MHAIAHQSARLTAVRVVYGLLATILVAAVALELFAHDTGWWQLGVFGMGADLALLAGAGSGLAQGQLHPRAVPLYNALHRIAGPAVLLAAVVIGSLGQAWLIGGLAWAFHIALDRALGYGLRTRDGFQRA